MIHPHQAMLVFAVFAISVTSIKLFLWYASRHLLAKINPRSAHTAATPTGGGIVFVFVFSIYLTLFSDQMRIPSELVLSCLGPLLVGVVGFIDDKSELHVRYRLPIYILASSWCIYWIGFPTFFLGSIEVDLGLFGPVFGVLSLLWLQNLYNFMDGIDGIAGIESVFVFGGAFLISNSADSISHLYLVIVGTVVGFLYYNWPSAKLFMGDAGSGFLGLLVGTFILYSELSIWTWLILLCGFLVDASLTISFRVMRGHQIYQAHSQHAYQHMNRWLGTKKTLAFTMLISVFWLFPIAWISSLFPGKGIFLLVLASLPLIIMDWLLGAGASSPRFRKSN